MRRTTAAMTLSILILSTVPGFPAGASARRSNPPANYGARRLSREPHDAFAADRRGLGRPAWVAPGEGYVLRGSETRYEPRLGLPTFLWAGERGRLAASVSSGSGPSASEAARLHLEEYAHLYALDPADIPGLKIRSVHDTGRGARIVTFSQEVDGIDVFRDEMKLALDRQGDLIAISGYLTRPIRRGAAFQVRSEEAVAAALADLSGYPFDIGDLRPAGQAQRGGFRLFSLDEGTEAASGLVEAAPAGAKKVWFRLGDGLEPAWNVIVRLGTQDGVESASYGYVISAADARILYRRDFTLSDVYAYRVWADPNGLTPYDGPQGFDPTPHPTGLLDDIQPAFLSQPLISLQSGPISTGDPWLPPAATQSLGNNVDAYADIASPDGFGTGDLRATTTSAGIFDRVYNTSLSPSATANQRRASITQLFYVNNWLHDWFYDAGFDEASGNAQANNFGRGGVGGDLLLAEGQDFSGRNNANMSTPPDGFNPIMQMYIFDGPSNQFVEVNSPPSIAGTKVAGPAQFGPSLFDVTEDVVLVNDGAGTPSDGCTFPFINGAAIAGKIALIDRGTCNFIVKVQNAESHAAAGVIIVNNTSGVITMGGTGFAETPSLMVSQADGNAIRTNLGSGVNARLFRDSDVDRDGTVDNQIVAHEWGHYISNRLVGNAFGLDTQMASGLGEGWGDFTALLMTVRAADAAAPANPNFSGVYALAGYAVGGPGSFSYYFGIRRAPYSTNFAKNPLTFRHIEEGVPLPGTAPLAFGQSGAGNSEVHNTGEIWANMLWECYAGLLRDTLGPSPRLSFAQAQQRMKEYLVAGYKMTPNSPTLLEARDAVLTAAAAGDAADLQVFWQAFAKRGAGVGAVAPDRYSSTNSGVVESYLLGGDLVLEDVLLDDGVATQCLPDGDLDRGETGSLTLTLRNTGSSALSSTTAMISSTNPSVAFPSGGSVVFPSSASFGTTTAAIPVSLSGAVSIQEAAFQISFDDPGLAVAGPLTGGASFRVNSDDLPAQSAADNVESDNSVWSVSSNPGLGASLPWERIALSGLDHRWHGPDGGGTTDVWLISPPLPVAPAGSFSFTFKHRHDFERGTSVFFDGGVIEISTNGGASWSDIGASAVPGYGGSIVTGGNNPIEGRPAYVGVSAGYPSLNTVTVSLGTAYQSQTVRVRFRIGTDIAVGAPGWEIDDIAFNNITSTPFPILVAHDPTCDADFDGTFDAADCAPGNGTLWSKPSAILDLEAGGGTTTLFTWPAPAIPGGSAPVTYDLLRSDGAVFGGATCLAANVASTSSMDAGIPSSAFYYLLGARNGCGRTIAPDSDGVARTAPACTP